jgi:hypothetical protein
MNQFALATEEDELGYEVDARQGRPVLGERREMAAKRQLNGQERRSQQSRFSRRPAPVRTSGSHRRRNKQTGM